MRTRTSMHTRVASITLHNIQYEEMMNERMSQSQEIYQGRGNFASDNKLVNLLLKYIYIYNTSSKYSSSYVLLLLVVVSILSIHTK